MKTRAHSWVGFVFTGLLMLTVTFGLTACQSAPALSQTVLPVTTLLPVTAVTLIPSPSSTPDRLAEPPLSPSPTQLEIGRHLYWLNCMACHGDKGQGLTAEFRAVYVEDANCWARGCHGGHLEDKGFPIPRTVPAIISSTGRLPPFATADQLFEFLRTTHPPQNPGFMPDGDYWALTAYLMDQNGRLPTGTVLGP